ncbi:hypothetical protein [Veronia nyctiphanis]|uniref:hypothetical protein n=1 Tax=Veronia nyctiphanis TaxID=1278244 RepID=UPI001F492DDF|nr:hypothetical protein [Veronia nyctiphanis]
MMKLEKVTKQTVYDVINLSLHDEQKTFVAPNAKSMAESAVNPDYQTRAAIVEGEIVALPCTPSG